MPIVPETAQAVAKNLNEYRYLQRNLQDDNGDNAMRDTAGRTLTFSGPSTSQADLRINKNACI